MPWDSDMPDSVRQYQVRYGGWEQILRQDAHHTGVLQEVVARFEDAVEGRITDESEEISFLSFYFPRFMRLLMSDYQFVRESGDRKENNVQLVKIMKLFLKLIEQGNKTCRTVEL
jgi:hypothetical protein